MRAVVFDLFETLITEWGKPKCTTLEVAQALDLDSNAFRREWEALHHDRYMGRLSGTGQVLKTILQKLGMHREAEQIAAIARRRDECKNRCFDAVEPSVLRMLSDLKGMGLQLGMISNCSAEEIESLYGSAIHPFFDVIVLSCDVEKVKPDPEIYAYCLDRLHEKPSDCAYIGDGGSNELFGASQVGLRPFRALWFTRHFVVGYDADKTYPAFEDPADFVRHIRAAV